MTVSKITISLPRHQVEQARAAVANGEATSVSSYISAALLSIAPDPAAAGPDSLAAFAADLIAEFGKPSPEDYAWADEVLGKSS
ncbi:MAG TPA: hypothetical protein VLJ42_11010 [Solirubrobacteraceae bacterium]|nr:hypothetical protein [Solirubrobacteraceae bacterium]